MPIYPERRKRERSTRCRKGVAGYPRAGSPPSRCRRPVASATCARSHEKNSPLLPRLLGTWCWRVLCPDCGESSATRDKKINSQYYASGETSEPRCPLCPCIWFASTKRIFFSQFARDTASRMVTPWNFERFSPIIHFHPGIDMSTGQLTVLFIKSQILLIKKIYFSTGKTISSL